MRFQGKLPSGVEIAVKRFAASSTQGSAEFTAEIETIANLQHRDVIRLLGFCIQREKDFMGFQIQQEEMILVYEKNQGCEADILATCSTSIIERMVSSFQMFDNS